MLRKCFFLEQQVVVLRAHCVHAAAPRQKVALEKVLKALGCGFCLLDRALKRADRAWSL
jgi:hypothetical protein